MKYGKDHILNPETGRYVLKTGAIGRRLLAARCTADTILNPATGRCVNKNGAIGKKLRSKSPKKSQKKRSVKKSCGKGKFRNSKTGRCKKIPSPVNEMSPRKSKGVKMSGAPAHISKILSACQLIKVWKKHKKLGKGADGITYQVCRGKECDYVMKIQKDDYEFRNEVKIMRKLKGFKHAPVMTATWICKGKGYILMENLTKLKGTKTEIYNKVKDALRLLNARNIAFPDCHKGNVMMRSDGTVVLIDFGWAAYFRTPTTKIHEPIFLSDELNRNVSFIEVKTWQNANFESEFGINKTTYNEALKKYNAIFEK